MGALLFKNKKLHISADSRRVVPEGIRGEPYQFIIPCKPGDRVIHEGPNGEKTEHTVKEVHVEITKERETALFICDSLRFYDDDIGKKVFLIDNQISDKGKHQHVFKKK